MGAYSDQKWDEQAIRLATKWVEADEVDFDADDILIVAEALLRRVLKPSKRGEE